MSDLPINNTAESVEDKSVTDLIHEDNERMVAEAREKAKIRICSFCGKDENSVGTMIAGMTAFICGECVQICADIVLRHLYDNARRLKETIKFMEKAPIIPPVSGVSDRQNPEEKL